MIDNLTFSTYNNRGCFPVHLDDGQWILYEVIVMTRNRALALVLCLVMLAGLVPVFPALAAEGYGKTTASGVRLRKTASTSSDYWFRVPLDYVCVYTGTVEAEGVTWYRVEMPDPEVEGSHAYVGYLHGDFYRPLTSEELTAWSQNPVNVVNNVAVPVQNYYAPGTATGSITNGGVNVRELPSTRSASLFKLDKGVVVELLSIPSASDTDPWYQIRYDNHVGYVQGPFIRVVTYGNLQAATAVPTATPAPGATANTQNRVISYVRLILTSAHLRTEPGGTVWEDWEEQGGLLPVRGEAVFQGDHYWYPVVYKNRDLYVRSDCVDPVYTEGGSVVTPTPTARAVLGHVITTQNNVNLRLSPNGTVIEQIPNNTILPYVAQPMTLDGYTWYYVESGNVHGYVRSDCVSLYGSSVTSGTATATPTPTPVRRGTVSSYGYVETIKTGVNMRSKPNGSRIAKIDINIVLAMTGNRTNSGGYDWYPVTYQGLYGYVRGDCVKMYTASEAAAYEARMGLNATPTPAQSTNHYVRTAIDGTVLRSTASTDGSILATVGSGVVLAFDQTVTGSGATWYRVIYNNRQLFVLSSNVTEMTDAEYQAYLGTNPTATPQTTLYAGYVRTTKSGINVRQTAGGRNILGRIDSGLVLPYSDMATYGGYTWYRVNSSVGLGYIRGDRVNVVNADGSPTAAPTAAVVTTQAPQSGQVEASYTTLKKGDKGTAVQNMVQELINQGYYTGTLTSTFSDAVEAAVKAFQTAKGMTADGVAGSATQHAIFGTVPVGTGNTTDLNMTIYPAEKIDWYTGGIQELIPRGSNFKVYDVKTGIVWWAHRWAGGKHADIEPLTAADTARICQIYGVSKASEINAKQHWQRRPCLITIGTRTFACSLYGVPHNPEGNTIKDNDMNGQICLHFTNSRTHDSDKVDSYHTEAIQYAWEHAPNGHK